MSTRQNIKVSVIIPTYNRAQFITQAIDSVLSQTYQDFEIIIIDDGSTDNTKEVLRPYWNDIKYIYQRNQGAAAARNTAVMHARGEYIAFLDSDDLWFPQKLEKQVDILEHDEEVGMVYTNAIFIGDDGNIISSGFPSSMIKSGYIFKDILLTRVECRLPTWLVRKGCFETLGGFDPDLVVAEDRDFRIRMSLKYKLIGIDEPLVKIRIHKEGRLGDTKTHINEYCTLQTLEKAFKVVNLSNEYLKLKRKAYSFCYLTIGKGYLQELNYKEALQRFYYSIKYHPFQLSVYIYLIRTLLEQQGIFPDKAFSTPMRQLWHTKIKPRLRRSDFR